MDSPPIPSVENIGHLFRLHYGFIPSDATGLESKLPHVNLVSASDNDVVPALRVNAENWTALRSLPLSGPLRLRPR